MKLSTRAFHLELEYKKPGGPALEFFRALGLIQGPQSPDHSSSLAGTIGVLL